jgi:hypothetical protein
MITGMAVGLLGAMGYSYQCLPRNVGQEPRFRPTIWPFLQNGMVFLSWVDGKTIHVHHWLLYGMLLTCVPLSPVPTGFVVGMCIQGLMYKDAFEFVQLLPD